MHAVPVPNPFYHSLSEWTEIEQLLNMLHPSEQEEARRLVNHTLDYAVHHAVLHHLPTEHHETYLHICIERHHDEGILHWLEEKVQGIREILVSVLKVIKEHLLEILK